MSLTLHISVSSHRDSVGIVFGCALAGRQFKVYDTVELDVSPISAYFSVDPTVKPLPSNLEFVLTGPFGAKPRTLVGEVDARLGLYVRINGELVPVPTAYSSGYITFEKVANVAAQYSGDYRVALTTGKARIRQVCYSNATPRVNVIFVLDAHQLLGGAHFVKEGEALKLPVGYAHDFGDGTRMLLRGYDWVSESAIALKWVRQHSIRVHSDRGSASSEGWYDEGATAAISISPLLPQFP